MKSAMVDWSSLLPELIGRVADCLLATNDIDYYMDMRAVCCSWRAAMADPCRRGAETNFLLFRPRQWIMLDEESESEHRLLVNVSTGRFLHRRFPLLREHVIVSMSDGLVILGERKPPHAARVLNPLTGSLIHFAISIPHEDIIIMSVLTGSEPTLIFCVLNDDGDVVLCADPTSKSFSVLLLCSAPNYIQSMVAYAGNIYTADLTGSLVKNLVTTHHCYSEGIAKISKASEIFLVKSAGELLLIRRSNWEVFEIFRVDVEQNMLEAVKSIGSQALLLGNMSLSVEANKLPSIQCNCLYYQVGQAGKSGMYMYDLRDGRESRISDTRVSQSHTESFSARPRSLVQVLLGHVLWSTDVKDSLVRKLHLQRLHAVPS